MISRYLAAATSGVCLNRKLKRLDSGILFELELVSLISYIPVAIPAKNIVLKFKFLTPEKLDLTERSPSKFFDSM